MALAERRLAGGDSVSALELARRLLALNPWHEGAARVGMRAAIQSNDRSTALRIYHSLEKSLSQDLGVTPQKELQDLVRSLTNKSK